MKIFDSTPGIILNRPGRRRQFTIAAAALVFCVAWASSLAYQRHIYLAKLAAVTEKLEQSGAQSSALRSDLASAQERLGASTFKEQHCSGELAATTVKIDAFAKQAAACEVIRLKLDRRG